MQKVKRILLQCKIKWDQSGRKWQLTLLSGYNNVYCSCTRHGQTDTVLFKWDAMHLKHIFYNMFIFI